MKERVFYEEYDSVYYYHGSTQNWVMEHFHFHKQYEIILFLNSGAVLEVDNKTYHVEKGDLFLLNNHEYHRVNIEAGTPHTRYVLMFDPAQLADMPQAFDYDFFRYFTNRPPGFEQKVHLSPDLCSRFEKLFAKIERHLNRENTPAAQVSLKISLLEILVAVNELHDFLRAPPPAKGEALSAKTAYAHGDVEFKSPALYRDRLESIKKYIQGHTHEKLSLNSIASEFYISRYYLSHYFKKETGFTVSQYITNQKMIAAKTMLKQGVSVAEIAATLSYSSNSHFITVFKSNCGVTPKQYAKSAQGEMP